MVCLLLVSTISTASEVAPTAKETDSASGSLCLFMADWIDDSTAEETGSPCLMLPEDERPSSGDLKEAIRSKPWRKQECGFWIPSASPLQSGHHIHQSTITGPLSVTIVWDDYWDPFYPQRAKRGVFYHTIGITLLSSSGAYPAEINECLVNTVLEILPELCSGDWWVDAPGGEPAPSDCKESSPQNPVLYDEIIRRVEKVFPDSGILDLYIEKIGCDIDFY